MVQRRDQWKDSGENQNGSTQGSIMERTEEKSSSKRDKKGYKSYSSEEGREKRRGDGRRETDAYKGTRKKQGRTRRNRSVVRRVSLSTLFLCVLPHSGSEEENKIHTQRRQRKTKVTQATQRGLVHTKPSHTFLFFSSPEPHIMFL